MRKATGLRVAAGLREALNGGANAPMVARLTATSVKP